MKSVLDAIVPPLSQCCETPRERPLEMVVLNDGWSLTRGILNTFIYIAVFSGWSLTNGWCLTRGFNVSDMLMD